MCIVASCSLITEVSAGQGEVSSIGEIRRKADSLSHISHFYPVWHSDRFSGKCWCNWPGLSNIDLTIVQRRIFWKQGEFVWAEQTNVMVAEYSWVPVSKMEIYGSTLRHHATCMRKILLKKSSKFNLQILLLQIVCIDLSFINDVQGWISNALIFAKYVAQGT